MRIYIAKEDDTLRYIARHYQVELNLLHSLNPHVSDPDSKLMGGQVFLPCTRAMLSESTTELPLSSQPPVFTDEQWIPLTSLEDMEQKDYDVLIVGTGAGGGAVLWRLMQQLGNSGKRIGVVERGGLLLQTNFWNIATSNEERYSKYFPSVAKMPGDFSQQVYALGGRTLFWFTSSLRMPVSEIMKWPVPIKEMENYYTLAERAMNVTQSFTEGASLNQILLNRLQHNGFPDAVDEPLAINLEPVNKFGVINSNPFFSSIVFFAQALNYRYDLSIHSRVVQVLTEKDRVAGVRVMTPDKKSYILKAKNVVLAASTLGTPQILLNSGIQGRAIGHYLFNHSRVSANGIINRSEFPEVLGPLHIWVPGNEGRPYQIQIIGPGNLKYAWVQSQEQPLKAEWECVFAASGKVEAKYDNKVTLDHSKRDEYGVPEIRVDFSYSEQDEVVIQQMKEGIEKVSSALKTPLLLKGGNSPFNVLLPGREAHDMGTCRMGDDPLTSATNRYGQIHGVQGLYVADNSVIPTSGTSNPTLTTVALAIRTADYIIQRLK